VTLCVADDGCGFEGTSVADDHHYGLTSMRERATLAGGSFVVETGTARGTAITATIPFDGVHAVATVS
jgi:signal transduction histidine kinase